MEREKGDWDKVKDMKDVQRMLGFFVGIATRDVPLKRCAPGDVVHLLVLDLFVPGQWESVSPSVHCSRMIGACRDTR